MLSLLSRQSANKNYSNPFRIRIFLFLAYSFGIETINTFTHSVVPSKTIPDSRPIWAKCIPVFRPKRRKTPTRWGGIYLYGLYKGVPHPPPPTPPGDNSLFRVGCTILDLIIAIPKRFLNVLIHSSSNILVQTVHSPLFFPTVLEIRATLSCKHTDQ